MVKKLLVVLCAVFVLCSCDKSTSDSGSTSQSLEPDAFGLKIAQMALIDELKSTLKDNESNIQKANAMAFIGIENAVTSDDLARDYEQDEGASNATYKDKTFLITGRATAITKDIFEEPYLALSGGSMFRDVHARFTHEKAKGLELFRKNYMAAVVCSINRFVESLVVMTDCSVIDTYIDDQSETIGKKVKNIVSGSESSTTDLDYVINRFYYVATLFPPTSLCKTTSDEAVCRIELAAILNHTDKKVLENLIPKEVRKRLKAK